MSAIKPTTPRTPLGAASKGNNNTQVFLFDKDNYRWMLIGLGVIFLAFFLMSGGKAPSPDQFNYDEIYSFRRITLAPVLLLIGFGIEAYAIMKRPKSNETAKEA
jgi:hypothetical protein